MFSPIKKVKPKCPKFHKNIDDFVHHKCYTRMKRTFHSCEAHLSHPLNTHFTLVKRLQPLFRNL